MKVAQSHQKSDTDRRHRPLEFEVGGQVFLKVSPTKGHMFISYHLTSWGSDLLIETAISVTKVHNVFHLPQLHKYIYDPSTPLNQNMFRSNKNCHIMSN